MIASFSESFLAWPVTVTPFGHLVVRIW